MLAGYKTYIVGVMAVLGAAASYLTGEIELANALQLALTAIIGMTLKHGQTTGA